MDKGTQPARHPEYSVTPQPSQQPTSQGRLLPSLRPPAPRPPPPLPGVSPGRGEPPGPGRWSTRGRGGGEGIPPRSPLEKNPPVSNQAGPPRRGSKRSL